MTATIQANDCMCRFVRDALSSIMQKNTRQLLLLAALLFIVALPAVRAQNEIKYTSCPGCWNPDSLGNHRAVIHFSGSGNMARVIIPWRRRDHSPENKRIILQDAQTGKRILNATTGVITRESGELFFEPVSGAGDYYVYYMPYRNEGRSNYPKGVYLRPDTTASADWLSALSNSAAGRGTADTVAIPVNCRVTGLQSIDDFNSFYPMELIATAKETS
jgi:Family of unknown function (DUF6067)